GSLKNNGVIEVEQLSKNKHDRTNYYAINLDHKSLQPVDLYHSAKPNDRTIENERSNTTKSNDRTPQNRTIDEHKTAPSMGTKPHDVTEITTKTTTEITSETNKPLSDTAADAT